MSGDSRPSPGTFGRHLFYESTAREDGAPVGAARFIHLWQHKDGA